MLVAVDHARHNRVAAEVDDVTARQRAAIGDGRDLVSLDHEDLVFDRLGADCVNQGSALQICWHGALGNGEIKGHAEECPRAAHWARVTSFAMMYSSSR